MSKRFNGDQVHGIRKLLIAELILIQLRSSREAIDQYCCWHGRVEWMWHVIGGIDAAEMRHMDGLDSRHGGNGNDL